VVSWVEAKLYLRKMAKKRRRGNRGSGTNFGSPVGVVGSLPCARKALQNEKEWKKGTRHYKSG